MRKKEEFELVCKLYKAGNNKSQIYRKTNIPRGTIKDWLNNPPKCFSENKKNEIIKEKIITNKELRKSYSYILGMYLGDGYINKCKRSYRLRISLGY